MLKERQEADRQQQHTDDDPREDIKRIAAQKRRQAEEARQKVQQEELDKRRQKQIAEFQQKTPTHQRPQKNWPEFNKVAAPAPPAPQRASRFNNNFWEAANPEKAARIRELDESANATRARAQSWKMHQILDIERKHGWQISAKEQALYREYGKEREKWEVQAKALEERLEKGGWWYNLTKAESDREELGKLHGRIANYKHQENQIIEALKRRQKAEMDEVLEQHKKLDEDTEKKIESAYKRAQALEERRENQITHERGGPRQGYYMRLEFP